MAAGAAAAAMAAVLVAAPGVGAGVGVGAVDGDRGGAGHWRTVTGHFAPPGQVIPRDAVTYDQVSVPAGSSVTVAQRVKGDRTSVKLYLRGVEADRSYGAHVHTRPCGAEAADSGPHYQHRVDPVRPSVDPEFANPRNEVWLDFDTDGRGDGGSVAHQEWTFREGEARSVVVHEYPTRTGPGEAGTAGERLACVTVPFAGGR